MLKQAKDKIAIFFNEKIQAKKYKKELRAKESEDHAKTVKKSREFMGRVSYNKLAKSENEQRMEWRD